MTLLERQRLAMRACLSAALDRAESSDVCHEDCFLICVGVQSIVTFMGIRWGSEFNDLGDRSDEVVMRKVVNQ